MIVQKKVAGLSEDSLRRFVARARRAAGVDGRVDVLITSNSAMQALNSQFRGKDKATDVLSFPTSSLNGTPSKSVFAGELAISAEIAAQNAATLGHSPASEVKVLVLHGILHLAGYDHERDNGAMAREETKLRRALNLPVCLIKRSYSEARPSVRRRRSPRSSSARVTK